METGRRGQPERERGQSAPERHPLPNCRQTLLLTKTSWGSGWWTSARRVTARDQLPRIDTRHTQEGVPVAHPENRAAGTGEGLSRSLQLGATLRAKHLVTWAARTRDGRKTQAQPSLSLCGGPENLNLSGLDLGSAYKPGPASDSSWQSNLGPEQCRLGKHTLHEQGQTQCGWITGSTCQWYLFVVVLRPQSTTEQVSLKKKVTSTAPLVAGWKLDTEETSKQKLK